MSRKQIGRMLSVSITGIFLIIVASDSIGQISFFPWVEIEVLPNGTYNPQDICESRPLRIKFTYHPGGMEVSLRSLRYSVTNENESVPFFTEIIDIDDAMATSWTQGWPIVVMPGIYTPPDSTKISVRTALTCSKQNSTSDITYHNVASISLVSAWPDWRPVEEKIYDRMRVGFIKRHILASGRELADVWLKQYDYRTDSKELLRFSRTQKVGGQTRVYIPWTHNCTGGDDCGLGVEEGSAVIYGGDENPLLRGGLAMATFSLEYIGYRRADSLGVAAQLYKYIADSEWIDPGNNDPTGFFLRTERPGYADQDDAKGREYWFASAEEILGMSLGLLYFHRALELKVSVQDPDQYYKFLKDSVEALVDRLGNQLRNNCYLIVPLVFDASSFTWRSMGLPIEFHKGAIGLYALEWFLSRGFRSITGNDYSVPDYIADSFSSFIEQTDILSSIPEGESLLEQAMVKGGIKFLLEKIQAKLTPKVRAIYSVQSLGFLMHYRGQTWEFVPPPCPPVPDPPPPWYEEVRIPIHIDTGWAGRYNYAMLLHAFQLGFANTPIDSYPDPDPDAAVIESEMARLIKGVLVNYRADLASGKCIPLTNIELKGAPLDLLTTALSLLAPTPIPGGIPLPPLDWECNKPGCSCTIDVMVGGGTWDDEMPEFVNVYDRYSASIARYFNLPGPYFSDLFFCPSYSDYWTAIDKAHSLGYWAHWLPMGQRDVNLIEHNPFYQWGTGTFCWEHWGEFWGGLQGEPIYGGGSEESSGLSDLTIQNTEATGLDTMREGSGMDYMLPFVLSKLQFIRASCGEPPQLPCPEHDIMHDALNYTFIDYLPACSNNAVQVALADLGLPNVKCSCTFQDWEKPWATLSLSGNLGNNYWYVSNVDINISADDSGGSGVKEIAVSINGGQNQVISGNTATFFITEDGTHQLAYGAADWYGNVGISHAVSIKIDKTPPTVIFGAATPAPNAKGWNKSDVDIPYTATDNLSGIDTTSPPSPLVFTAEGSGTVQNVTVDDNAGNSAIFDSPAVNLDKTSPSITVASPQTKAYLNSESMTFDFAANDALSGLATLAATLDGVAVTAGQKINLYSLSLANHVLAVSAVDNADNSSSGSVTFSIYATAESTKQVVNQLLASGAIRSSGVVAALNTLLDLAGKAIEKGQTRTAASQLTAFIGLVNAQKNILISLAAADALIAAANYILSTLPL